MVGYDKNFVNHFLTRTFKYNRTCTAFNLTFNCLFEDFKNIELAEHLKPPIDEITNLLNPSL